MSAIFSVTVLSLIVYYDNKLSDKYSVVSGDKLEFKNEKSVTVSYGHTAKSSAASEINGVTKEKVSLKLFGVFPIKQASVETVNDSFVYVIGKPFGIKLYTDGVLVVGINDVKTDNGSKNPAKAAGLKIGDSIITANDQKVKTNEELSEIISKSNGNNVKLKISRSGQIMHLTLKPVYSDESLGYKAGIWVRDSSAGVGTLTFYSPSTKIIGGLGHGICDTDTNTLLNLSSGELVTTEIVSCNRSEVGNPGELIGRFTGTKIAPLYLNSNVGVFGVSDIVDTSNCSLMKMATKQETKDGYAQILSTVDSGEAKLYDCTIKILSTSDKEQTQNIYVTVTDKELLSKTGGIVQGMSGSPIIQNGKLIGAVTHVLVDDPTRGYGIFAENMLETAKNVEQLKEAG